MFPLNEHRLTQGICHPAQAQKDGMIAGRSLSNRLGGYLSLGYNPQHF